MDVEKDLQAILENFRYESRSIGGLRGLQQYHIDALKAALLPYVTPLADDAWKYRDLSNS